jgi:hypothetical protein
MFRTPIFYKTRILNLFSETIHANVNSLTISNNTTWGSERVVGVRLSPLPLLARLCSVPLSLAAPSRFLNVRERIS